MVIMEKDGVRKQIPDCDIKILLNAGYVIVEDKPVQTEKEPVEKQESVVEPQEDIVETKKPKTKKQPPVGDMF